MTQADDDALKAKLVAEAKQYEEKFLPEGSKMYEFVHDIAKEMHIPSDNIKRIMPTLFCSDMVMSSNGILMIETDELRKFSLEALKGMIKHELWHSKQYKENEIIGRVDDPGIVQDIVETINSVPNLVNPLHREIEADFAAGKEFIKTAEELRKSHPNYDNPANVAKHKHQTLSNRLKMSLVKAGIEKVSGLSLEPDDVDIADDGKFTIKNLETPEAKFDLASKMALRELGYRYQDTGKKFTSEEYTTLVDKHLAGIAELNPEIMQQIEANASSVMEKTRGKIIGYDDYIKQLPPSLTSNVEAKNVAITPTTNANGR